MITVAVAGATGRLGSLVCEIVEADPNYNLVAKLSSNSRPEEEGAEAQILVDVSHPDASPAIVERALNRGQRVLVGTSGWSEARLAPLREQLAGSGGTVIVVPNFSLGSVLGTVLARLAAPFYDSIEIIEAHHPAKVDSPSGTAVRTAELMAEARNGHAVKAPFVDQPARGKVVAGIPVHSLRLAGVVAKQEVRLGGPGEVLSITHDTHSDEAYRAGITAALTAIQTASGLTVGLEGVLGLNGIVLNPSRAHTEVA